MDARVDDPPVAVAFDPLHLHAGDDTNTFLLQVTLQCPADLPLVIRDQAVAALQDSHLYAKAGHGLPQLQGHGATAQHD